MLREPLQSEELSIAEVEMTGPISPKEAKSGKHIPDEVFEAFNELICEGSGGVRQSEVVKRILMKMPHVQQHEVFAKGWLDVEEAYQRKGWKVTYDKPGYNESYEANFVFVRR